MNFFEWTNRKLVVFILLTAFVWTGIECVTDAESISIFEFIFDTLEKSLLIGGAAGVVLLLRQNHKQETERRNLLGELEVARTHGGKWRKRAQLLIDGVGVLLLSNILSALQ